MDKYDVKKAHKSLYSRVRLLTLTEGTSIQILHIAPMTTRPEDDPPAAGEVTRMRRTLRG